MSSGCSRFPPRRSAGKIGCMSSAIAGSGPSVAGRVDAPRYILMHPNDNVAIVVNDGGLPAGSRFSNGLVLRERVPQGHKIALNDLAEGAAIVRYGVTIGHALRDI